jgi:hypothetical protein
MKLTLQTKFLAINKDFWEKRKLTHGPNANERAVDAI